MPTVVLLGVMSSEEDRVRLEATRTGVPCDPVCHLTGVCKPARCVIGSDSEADNSELRLPGRLSAAATSEEAKAGRSCQLVQHCESGRTVVVDGSRDP